MSIDPYTVCPGGTGKKVKFCCSDLVSELDKLSRMIEGEQNVAALDYATKLEAKFPQRACLMGMRSMLEMALDKPEQAQATLSTFLEKYPDNRVALRQLAVLKCREQKSQEALPIVLRLIEVIGDDIESQSYSAIGAVALALVSEGHLLAARVLLLKQMQMSGGKDEHAKQLLVEIQKNPSVPLVAKDDPDFMPPPDGAPWKFEFDRAYQRAREGQWKLSEEKFSALTPLAGQSPALWWNLAVLRGRQADEQGMAEALHRYAGLDVPLDNAVEAEALAQYFDEAAKADALDVVEIEYAATSQTDLEERLAADRQIERVPFDPRSWPTKDDMEGGEDPGPPPRAVFNLLDMPAATSVAGLTHEQIPEIIASMQLFGRQTDRAERLVIGTTRDQLAAVEALVKRIGGDALGERSAAGEEVVDQVRTIAQLFQWDWRIPKDARAEDHQRLIEAERRERVLNRLPKLRLAQIGNQTLEEAAKDPAGRIRAAGLLMLISGGSMSAREAAVFDELGRQLGLPQLGPIDPTTSGEVDLLPPVRFARVEVEKLSDDSLRALYRQARICRATRAIVKAAEEILRRPSMAELLDIADVHGVLASLAETLEEAVAQIEQARAIHHQQRLSSAPWDLQELALQLRFGDVRGASRTFDHIRREHLREEGMAEAISQLLVSFGLVDQAGRVLLPPVEEASPVVVPGGGPSKILTPDAAGAGAGQKSALWVPGMD